MKPVVDRLREQFGSKIEFRQYWDGEGEDLARQFNVQYVPTFVFVGSDGTVVERTVGGMSEEQLRRKLESLK